MKKIFTIKKLFSIFFLSVFILLPLFKVTTAQSQYSLTATADRNKINILLLSPPLQNSTVQPLVSESSITSVPSASELSIISSTDPLYKKTLSPDGKTTWSVSKKADTLYYVRVFDVNTRKFITDEVQVKTGPAGDIYFNKDEKFYKDKDSANAYILSGSINKDKHKNSDPIPLEKITVSAFFYKFPKTDGDSYFYSPEKIKLKEVSGGNYMFKMVNPPFEQNTDYTVVVVFESESGSRAEHSLLRVNTEEGIIPESGKGLENYVNENSYRLLAPIPGMTMLLDPKLCEVEQQRNPGQICDINAFLNFILSFAIGLAAVVLVIRIILDGYGYMISDVPFVKTKLKGRFLDAMVGLVVALSAYLILNTISPRLVENEFKVGEVEFKVEEDDNNIITNDRFTRISAPRTSRSCKGKIVDIVSGNGSFIDVCDEISEKVAQMFLDAKNAGIVLSGGGYRTYQEQTKLYNDNCGGGSRRCDPKTAPPGTSMHETGKAFDLKCDGSLITFSTPFKGTRTSSTKKCFDWLSINAYKYGLINLKKENWHWSVNGK